MRMGCCRNTGGPERIHVRHVRLVALAAWAIIGAAALWSWGPSRVQAATADGTPPPATSAEQVVRKATDQIVALVRKEGTALQGHPDRAYALVNDALSPYVDYRQLAQRALGVWWRRASPAEQEEFTHQFHILMMRTIALAVSQMKDLQNKQLAVRYLQPVASDNGDRVLVRTRVVFAGGQPANIDYRMHRIDGSWKLSDVIMEGVSLLVTYRSQFTDVASRVGVRGLIERLAAKNRAGGTLAVPGAQSKASQ